MLEYVLLAVPVVFLVASVYFAYKNVVMGRRSRKSAVLRQIASFAIVGSVCLITSMVAMGMTALCQVLSVKAADNDLHTTWHVMRADRESLG